MPPNHGDPRPSASTSIFPGTLAFTECLEIRLGIVRQLFEFCRWRHVRRMIWFYSQFGPVFAILGSIPAPYPSNYSSQNPKWWGESPTRGARRFERPAAFAPVFTLTENALKIQAPEPSDTRHVRLYAETLRDSSISAAAKIVVSQLRWYCHRYSGESWTPPDRIASACGMEVSEVRAALNELEVAGLIKTEA